jgi:AraC-like DNA-binding protein
VAEQVAALLALAAGPETHATSVTDKLLVRIRRTIRERCHEPDLNPSAVADAHRISKRYLHHLCARSSTTFCLELMRVRLELAHRIMSDARYDKLPISEVAAQCGFVEPSHFAKRFRKVFGVGPTQFRAGRTA